jgi:hypothetical protein
MVFGLVSRFRVLVSAFSIASFLFLFFYANSVFELGSPVWCEVVDLSFWVLASLTVVAGVFDVLLYWREYPAFSSYLLSLMGVFVTVIARLASTMYTLILTSFSIQIVGGSIIDVTSFRCASMSIVGACLVLTSTGVSTWFRRPVIFVESRNLYSILQSFMDSFSKMPSKFIFLASFLIGFFVRLYPEVKYLNLPIGWDTIEYIANARDFAYAPKLVTTYPWGAYRNIPPLLTWIPGLLSVAGLDPWIFYKVYPSIVIGCLAGVSATLTRRLTRSNVAALAASIAIVFNPYIIGQSQQWHRHMLGTLLLLIYLYLCEAGARSPTRAFILTLTSMSYEPSAVLSIILSITEVLHSRKWWGKIMFTLSTVISAVMLLFYVGFPQNVMVATTPIGIQIVGGLKYSASATIQYTIVCLLMMSPSLAMLRIWKAINVKAKIAFITLFIASMLPAVSTIAPVDQHRWFLMLLTILTPYTVAGLINLSKKIVALSMIVIMLAGVAYVFTEEGCLHFRIWPSVSTPYASGYPWKLAPATTNLMDVENIAGIISVRSGVVLTSLYLYPQIHLYVRLPSNIIVSSTEPDILMAIYILNKTKMDGVLVATGNNLTKQFIEYQEDPYTYYAFMSVRYGKGNWIDIHDIICREVYRGSAVSLYEITINNKGD